MGRRALRIEVAKRDQKELRAMLSGGVQQVRAVLRAMALLQLGKGVSAPRIAEFVPLTPQAIRKVGHRYVDGGLECAVFEKERPGAAGLLKDGEKQRIIAMVCADPPEGYARWTVRLVAEEAVKRRILPRVGRETIRILLLSHELKPWLGKKCGAFRNSAMSTSPEWKTFWKRMSGLTTPPNRWSVWMRSRLRSMPKCGALPRRCRAGKPDEIANTKDAAQPTSSAR